MFRFCDTNTALVNTLEAIQNAPSNLGKKPREEKEVISEFKEVLKIELKRELNAELTTEFKEELATHIVKIITITKTYALKLNSNLHEVL